MSEEPRYIDPDARERQATLAKLRIVWAAMLMGQIIFLIVAFVIRPQTTPNPIAGKLVAVAMAVVVLSMPASFMIRKSLYTNPGVDGRISPQNYFKANIMFLAILEAGSILGIVSFLLGAPAQLALLPTLVAIAAQIMNYPRGTAMGE